LATQVMTKASSDLRQTLPMYFSRTTPTSVVSDVTLHVIRRLWFGRQFIIAQTHTNQAHGPDATVSKYSRATKLLEEVCVDQTF
jgi:hypothetical protein